MLKYKVYVAIKPCDIPIHEFHDNGIRYYEDDIGYYYIIGELECDIN